MYWEVSFSSLQSLDAESLIHAAVKFELYVIVFACVIAICLMSLAAAWFIIKTALHHAFPEILEFILERLRRARIPKSPPGPITAHRPS